MRLAKTKRSHSVVFNLTPMIDIVFLLIIFFMTVSQITRVVDQPMQLPVVVNGATPEPPATVTLNLDKDGKIIVAGKEFKLERTLQLLKQKTESLSNPGDMPKIEIRCDKRCSSDHFNRIIEELSGIGFTQVRISVSGEN